MNSSVKIWRAGAGFTIRAQTKQRKRPLPKRALERCGEFVRMEAEGAGLALVDDAALGVDEVNAVGPAGVGLLGGVGEIVEQRGELDAELADAGGSEFSTFVLRFWAREDDVVLDVALHLPDVAGMRFEDVNRVERDAVVIPIVELVEGRNLPPEGRSSVAAKDEHDGRLSAER